MYVHSSQAHEIIINTIPKGLVCKNLWGFLFPYTMKHILSLLAIFFLVVGSLSAIPAHPRPFVVQQKDGSLLTVYLRGDECFHFHTTEDNIPIVLNEDNSFYYAEMSETGLKCGTLLAHSPNQRTAIENSYIKNYAANLQAGIQRKWSNERMTRGLSSAKGNHILPQKRSTLRGQKKGLVILVNFADISMSSTEPQNTFHRMFNEKGYSENNHIGSVHDYFFDQSYGAFDLTFDVVGPFTLSRECLYYGRNQLDGTSDVHAGQMIVEACQMADRYVNYKDYDWDGDGEVEQVFVIYAGYGESSGAASYTVWPHKFSLSGQAKAGDVEGPLLLDGIKIDTYACSCELSGTYGKKIDGIGTACHEFSHCLGLPDLYNVNYSGGFGMNVWDIMASGSSSGPGGNGEVPCGYSAYEREYLGWLESETLSEPSRIKEMPDIGEMPVAYKIYNDGHADEYLILENRQNTGWFSYVGKSVGCHGLLVSHIDYSENAWKRNEVNALRDHQRVSVIPADGSYGKLSGNSYIPTDEDLKGDLFPGSANIRELTHSSHTAVGGKWFNPNSEGSLLFAHPVTNIKETNGNVSFDFMGGMFVPTPIVAEALDIQADGFTIEWESIEPVDSFAVEVQEVRNWINPLEHILSGESFSKFKSDPLAINNATDLSLMLDDYTVNKGWSGKGVYASSKGVIIGNDSAAGYIVTPLLDIQGRDITLRVSLSSSEADSIITAIINTSSNDTIRLHKTGLTNSIKTYTLHFTDLEEGTYRILFQGESSFCMGNLNIYNGYFTAEELSTGGSIGGFAKPIETIYQSGITSNSYTVRKLKNKKYQFRVKAFKEDVSSDWSAYQIVDINLASNIPTTVFEERPPIRIFDLTGRPTIKPLKGKVYIFDFGDYQKVLLVR